MSHALPEARLPSLPRLHPTCSQSFGHSAFSSANGGTKMNCSAGVPPLLCQLSLWNPEVPRTPWGREERDREVDSLPLEHWSCTRTEARTEQILYISSFIKLITLYLNYFLAPLSARYKLDGSAASSGTTAACSPLWPQIRVQSPDTAGPK